MRCGSGEGGDREVDFFLGIVFAERQEDIAPGLRGVKPEGGKNGRDSCGSTEARGTRSDGEALEVEIQEHALAFDALDIHAQNGRKSVGAWPGTIQPDARNRGLNSTPEPRL